MVGKIRGFLFLFLLFMGLAVASGILAFVDLNRTWNSIDRWAQENIPFMEAESEIVVAEGWEEDIKIAKLFTDAAVDAMKKGEAGVGDLYDIGQFYMDAKEDGKIDNQEFDQMFNMAEQSGIADAVMDKFLEPIDNMPVDPQPAILQQQIEDLMGDLQRAYARGGMNARETMSILNRARTSGMTAQVMSMLPPNYDEGRARQAVRNLAKAMARGRASISDANQLMQMFMKAMSDGKFDTNELNQLTMTAERMAR